MPHLGVGDQLEDAVHHAEAGPQDGDDGQLLALQGPRPRHRQGRLNLDIGQGEVAGDLVDHQPGDLLQQLAELLDAGVPASDDAHLVLDKGVIEHDHAAAGGEPGAEVRDLSRSDLVDAREVAPSLEWGLQPRVQDGESLLGFQDPPAQGEHIEVVVGLRHARTLDVVAGRGPYALYLVRRYGHADPRPAEKHPAVGLSLRDSPGRLERDIGIVHPFLRIAPEVLQPNLRAQHKVVHRHELQDVTSMVASNGNFHSPTPPSIF